MKSLRVQSLSVRFGSKLILDHAQFELPSHGVVALMGPGGAGKSTLLRTLAGLNSMNTSMHVEGHITYLGRDLLHEESPRPALVVQRPDEMSQPLSRFLVSNLPCRGQMTQREQRETLQRFLTHVGVSLSEEDLKKNLLEFTGIQRRDFLILREVLADPAVLLLDESADGFDDPTAILERIQTEAQNRCILLVTHNQTIAQKIADRVLLLAGGKIQEDRLSADFFDAPQSQAGREWLRSGSCSVPSPDSKEDSLDPSWVLSQAVSKLSRSPRTKANSPVSASQGPRGFRWVTPGRYGGTQQPGLLADADLDLRALHNVGTTVLVTLTEKPLPCRELCEAQGISVLHVPIVDMKAPSVEVAAALCDQVRKLAEEGEVVVYHCKAGIGRTGTMLAAQLIWEGSNSRDAIRHVRASEPRYIQSTIQEEFLIRFAREVGSDRANVE